MRKGNGVRMVTSVVDRMLDTVPSNLMSNFSRARKNFVCVKDRFILRATSRKKQIVTSDPNNRAANSQKIEHFSVNSSTHDINVFKLAWLSR